MDETAMNSVERLAAAADYRETEWQGLRTAWRCFGEGRPVVLLHGDFGSWTHFVRNIDALSARFRVLAADMPGYGRSDTPPEPHLPDRLAAPLAAGVDELLGPDAELDIVGFSYGGIVAGHLAAMLGSRVGRLLLSGPGGFGMRSGPSPGVDLKGVREGMSEAEIDAVHRHNLGRLMIADPACVDDLAVRIQRENIAAARVRCGRIPETTALLDALPRVRARLSGIWGGADAFSDPERLAGQVAALRRFDPDMDFQVVPGAGHWLFYEASETANRWLLRTLEGSSGV
jgi:pimeloyl-ACP methyl ester carboxylesterase